MVANALARAPRWDFDVPNVNNLLQPIQRGYEQGMQDRQQAVENTRADEQLGMQRERLGFERSRMARQDESERLTRLGKMAAALHTMPDTPEKAARAKALLDGHADLAPQFARYGINGADPVAAVGMLAQSWGELNPLDIEAKRAQIAQSRASTNLATIQAQNAGQTDIVRNLRAAGIDPNSDEGRGIIRNSIRGGSPIDQAVAQAIQGAMPTNALAPPQPSVGQPRVQQQSMPMEPDQPQLIPAQAAPGPAPAPQQQGEAMVDTPLGRMPERSAKIIGFGLAMQGKGEAGKMMSGEPGLGRTALNEVDEQIVKGLDQLSRLEGMAQTFQDRYQTMSTRLGMIGTGWLAKIDPSKVSPDQARELAEFARDRRRSIENLNLTIKDITGAAMSIPEAQRIMEQVPNPGTGVFDGDNFVTYRSKLNDAIDQTRLAVARRSWLKKNNAQLLNQLAQRRMEGIENLLPLDRMRDIMNERKNQIFQELRQRSPNASPQQLLPFVGQQLRQEFGI